MHVRNLIVGHIYSFVALQLSAGFISVEYIHLTVYTKTIGSPQYIFNVDAWFA